MCVCDVGEIGGAGKVVGVHSPPTFFLVAAMVVFPDQVVPVRGPFLRLQLAGSSGLLLL